MKILVSDGTFHNRENLASYLRQSGLDVVATAASGAETLQLAAELSPDIFILDINLPDMDTLELTTRLSKADRPAYVILLTVSEDNKIAHDGKEAGAYACLAKNAGIDPVIDTIQQIKLVNFKGDQL